MRGSSKASSAGRTYAISGKTSALTGVSPRSSAKDRPDNDKCMVTASGFNFTRESSKGPTMVPVYAYGPMIGGVYNVKPPKPVPEARGMRNTPPTVEDTRSAKQKASTGKYIGGIGKLTKPNAYQPGH